MGNRITHRVITRWKLPGKGKLNLLWDFTSPQWESPWSIRKMTFDSGEDGVVGLEVCMDVSQKDENRNITRFRCTILWFIPKDSMLMLYT